MTTEADQLKAHLAAAEPVAGEWSVKQANLSSPTMQKDHPDKYSYKPVRLMPADLKIGENDSALPLANLIAAALNAYTAPPQHAAALPECYRQLLLAATGLTFGTDWNSGTHAKRYREQLIAAAKACAEFNAINVGTTGHVDQEQHAATRSGWDVFNDPKPSDVLNRYGQHAATEEKYHELLYAVGNKYPNETRHETALRYIRGAEQHAAMVPEMQNAVRWLRNMASHNRWNGPGTFGDSRKPEEFNEVADLIASLIPAAPTPPAQEG